MTVERDGANAGAYAEIVAVLTRGLDGIGKTDVSMVEVQSRGSSPPQVQTMLGHADLYAVTLETSALMIDPHLVNAAASLRTDLENYVQDASNGTLELVRFFAQQSLRGGYVARRLRLVPTYQPFVLMEPGSTFLLRGDGAPIQSWLRTVHASVGAAVWCRPANLPHLPENGCGAIALNAAATLWGQGDA